MGRVLRGRCRRIAPAATSSVACVADRVKKCHAAGEALAVD